MNNALEIRNLTKAYKDFKLDNVTFDLPMGCVMGLIGENGAGKSTIIKLILDIIDRDGGSVRILGKDNKENIKLSKEDVGVVLDEVGLPESLNSVEIGKIMRHTYRNWDEDAYKWYLNRLALPLDKPFKSFSKGMKMKMGIAIALSHNAKLLIFDEATSGLDPVARNEFAEIIRDFTRKEDHSVLISSHIVSDLEKLCDYILFLHKGKVMIYEEKDRLLSEFCIVLIPLESLNELDRSSILHVKRSPYGAEVIIKRNAVPRGVESYPITIEELFVFMIKEAGAR